MNLGWGDKPWSKNGDKCRMEGGGIGKIFADGGEPSKSALQGKKPCPV